MAIEIRTIKDDERTAFIGVTSTCFGLPPSQDAIDSFRIRVPTERVFAAFDGTQLVCTSYSLPFELTLPNLQVAPLAWVAAVSTLPSHRHRGIATEVMVKQLHALRDEGYFLAGLGATSQGLYRRVGYAPAAYNYELCLPADRPLLSQKEEVGAIDFVSWLDVDELVTFHDRYRVTCAGEISRDARVWQKIVASETAWVSIRDHSGALVAAAAYSMSEEPNKVVMTVSEIFAMDARLLRRLWSVVCGFDVADEIRVRAIAADDPIFAMLSRPGRATSRRFENPWLRILDVERALTTRSYHDKGTLVLGVRDESLPDNAANYRLEVDSSGTAICSKTKDSPDLSLDIADLAATYLAGRSFKMLHEAGVVGEHREGSIVEADRFFACAAVPFCSLLIV